MNAFKIFWFGFMICCLCAAFQICAYAEDLYPENTFPTGEDNPYYQTELSSPEITGPSSPEITEPSSPEITESSSPEISEPQNIIFDDSFESVYDPIIVDTVAPITPNNTNGFQAVILGLLGNYSPIVIEYAYQNTSGYYSYLREVQPDYSWIASAVIFLVVIYCLFRLIGGLIKK